MAVKKNKGGRPSRVNRDTYKRICKLIVSGDSVTEIARKLGVTRQVIYKWRKNDATFAEMYKEAQEMRAEDLTFEILSIADDDSRDLITDPSTGRVSANNAAVQRDKLKMAARTKFLTWLDPKRYAPNQKVDVTSNGNDFYQGIVITPPPKEDEEE